MQAMTERGISPVARSLGMASNRVYMSMLIDVFASATTQHQQVLSVKMASTRQLVIPTKLHDNGPFHISNLTQESADKLAQLLTWNHDKYHLSYHQFGLHSTFS